MKKNLAIIFFLCGCATTVVVQSLSFKDAIAQTGSKCHYLGTYSSAFDLDTNWKNTKIDYSKEAKDIIGRGWTIKSAYGMNGYHFIIWEKCKN